MFARLPQSLLLLLGVLCGVQASDVITLSADNFEERTQSVTGGGGVWFVNFYDPWCGACEFLAPVWEELATELKDEVHVASVNANTTENRPLRSRFRIRGFPTVYLFHEGKMFPYNKEGPSVPNFLNFVRGGFEKVGAEKVPPVPTHLEMLWRQIKSRYMKAKRDVSKGHYFTFNTLVMAVPAYFILVVIVYKAARSRGTKIPIEEKKRD